VPEFVNARERCHRHQDTPFLPPPLRTADEIFDDMHHQLVPGCFAAHGIRVEAMLTDNAWTYRRAQVFRDTAEELTIRQFFIRPRRPQTNGKVERYNRTSLEEWAYLRLYRGNAERARSLPAWLHRCSYHRSHTALGGLPPIARVNNLSGNYS
jgi:transposase InsO family protein